MLTRDRFKCKACCNISFLWSDDGGGKDGVYTILVHRIVLSIGGYISVLRTVLPSLQARRAETMVDGLPRACRLWPWPIDILATFEPKFLKKSSARFLIWYFSLIDLCCV